MDKPRTVKTEAVPHHGELPNLPGRKIQKGLSMPKIESERGLMPANSTIQPKPFLRGLTGVWRIPRMLLIGIVRLYQMGISPFFPSTCRFAPTCSQYAILSLKKYGALRGTILAIWRILRCNPWGGHGHDPPRWFGEKGAGTVSLDEN